MACKPPLGQEREQEIVKAYVDMKMSLRALERKFPERTFDGHRRMLQRHGVEIRGRGKARK